MEKAANNIQLLEGIRDLTLKGFLEILTAHRDAIVKLAHKDARFRQMLKGKLETLKAHSHIDIMYFDMVA